MKLTITDDATQWFIDEMELKQGDSIQFFAKVYGPHDGYSIGINKAQPTKAFKTTENQGINFYVEENDAWFFDNQDLDITLHDERREPHYELIKK